METQEETLDNLQTTSPSKNSANINDHNNGNIVLTLSVSTEEVQSKEEGKKKTNFELREFDLKDSEALKVVLKSRNYSTNTWSGTCHANHYTGMTGLTFDYDGGMTLENALTTYAPYYYVIHTSTNHMVDKDGIVAERFRVILPLAPDNLHYAAPEACRAVYNNALETYQGADPQCKDPARKYFPFTGEEERFECYINTSGEYFTLPEPVTSIVDIASGIVFPEENEGIDGNQPGLMKMVRNCPIIQRFEADPSWVDYNQWLGIGSNYACFQGGKERFTLISRRDAGRFDQAKIDSMFREYWTNWHGPQTYDTLRAGGITFDLPSNAPKSPAAWRFVDVPDSQGLYNPDGENYLAHDEELRVRISGEWQTTDLEELKSTDAFDGTSGYKAQCTNCSEVTATLSSNQLGFVSMTCSGCGWDAHEYPVSPGMFVYMSQIHRVETRSNRFISFEKLVAANFRTKADHDLARQYLHNAKNRQFLSDNFQICRIGDASLAKLQYRLEPENNRAVFEYPALPVEVKDNAFIDRFLQRMFGKYAGFIKEWMAMYCYTNFQQLPVIVLTGPRGCGKNTFAQMVGAIFPQLVGLWNGDSTHFNEQYTKKLLFVDENPNADKVTQYTEIKKLTGNDQIKINEKYKPEYQVPNNVHVIITTNDHKPIFLKWQEQPQSPKNNNFFILELPELPDTQIDKQLGEKVRARLGHYVRTELRRVYDRLLKSDRMNNRYGIEAPITPFAEDLYQSARTSVEMEAEILGEAIINGMCETKTTPQGGLIREIWYQPKEWNGDHYVKLSDIKDLIKYLGLKGASTIKSYTEALGRMGIISMRSDYKNRDMQLGYKILAKK